MAIPFLSLSNSDGEKFNIIQYTDITQSVWVSLVANTPNTVTIPDGMEMVRFDQDFGVNVYSSPAAISIPTAGASVFSSAEGNAVLRDLRPLITAGILALNLLSTEDTTVRCHFYRLKN